MEINLRKKYELWLKEEKEIKKQELKLSIFVTFVILLWGLPFIFIKDKLGMAYVTPIFFVVYIFILIKLKKLNNHMITLLNEMILIKNKIIVNESNKELISIINGLELYYIVNKNFLSIGKINEKINLNSKKKS